MRNSHNSSAGFTLIETLVAFMILALSLGVLFRIFASGTRTVELSSDYARALQVAESQLASAGTDTPFFAGTSRGEVGNRYRWQRDVELYNPGLAREMRSASPQAFKVEVMVEWDRGPSPQRIKLHTIRLLQPEQK